jgi:HTH-type transcriptional regulator/antitoxin HigA
MNALSNSPEEEELELWALLVDRYESDRFVIEIPDPIEAIKFRMEQEGLRQKDPVKYLPGRAASPKS